MSLWRRWGGGRVALVATGSLTNVALLLTLYPEVLPMVEVVFMGGSMGAGNTGPVSVAKHYLTSTLYCQLVPGSAAHGGGGIHGRQHGP
eukprot:3791627-Pyramimonas_sp.AAC.1